MNKLVSEGDHSEHDCDEAAGHKYVDAALEGGELVSAGVEHTDNGEEVEDFSHNKESDHGAVDWHVVVDVEEANHGSEDAGNSSVDEHGCVSARGCNACEAVVVCSHIGLLVEGVNGQHDSIKLVERGLTHHMADVRDATFVARKLSTCTADIAEV
jgi:hypothetical protein